MSTLPHQAFANFWTRLAEYAPKWQEYPSTAICNAVYDTGSLPEIGEVISVWTSDLEIPLLRKFGTLGDPEDSFDPHNWFEEFACAVVTDFLETTGCFVVAPVMDPTGRFRESGFTLRQNRLDDLARLANLPTLEEFKALADRWYQGIDGCHLCGGELDLGTLLCPTCESQAEVN